MLFSGDPHPKPQLFLVHLIPVPRRHYAVCSLDSMLTCVHSHLQGYSRGVCFDAFTKASHFIGIYVKCLGICMIRLTLRGVSLSLQLHTCFFALHVFLKICTTKTHQKRGFVLRINCACERNVPFFYWRPCINENKQSIRAL